MGRYNENINPEVPITKRRKGSKWFEIKRDLAATIVKDTLFVCYVDEHYLPTMLTVDKTVVLANRSLTCGLVYGRSPPGYVWAMEHYGEVL
ncbi:hypothetical protein HID58_004238 [Brassica napus]|uniref:F-box associated domain-containing protein n=1 Tax=Brassica napus TaxID=3708 RepID=A0ABQ8E578_BRANA|nr:hypothetical protein HID58_004238 [Brassica napus]